ncbi:MAG TPA: hypothetical protein VGC85_02105, partial [Chthoniobacterales bacterium]
MGEDGIQKMGSNLRTLNGSDKDWRQPSVRRRDESLVCVVDWDLQIVEANRAARDQCALGTRNRQSPSLVAVAAASFAASRGVRQLKTHWRESLRHNPADGEAKCLTVIHPEVPSFR